MSVEDSQMHETRTERFITPRRRRPNGHWCIRQSQGKQSKGKHGKGKGKGKQGQHGQDKDRSKDKNKDSVECWNCGKRGHYSKDCWSKKNTNKGGSKGKYKPKECNGCSCPVIFKAEVPHCPVGSRSRQIHCETFTESQPRRT